MECMECIECMKNVIFVRSVERVWDVYKGAAGVGSQVEPTFDQQQHIATNQVHRTDGIKLNPLLVLLRAVPLPR